MGAPGAGSSEGIGSEGSTDGGSVSVGVDFGDVGLRTRLLSAGSDGSSFWAKTKLPITKLKTASTMVVRIKDFIFYSFHLTVNW